MMQMPPLEIKPAHIDTRDYKKLHSAISKLTRNYVVTLFDSLANGPWYMVSPEDKPFLTDFCTIVSVIKQLKNLTRKQGYDKMCIEQDLLGSCNSCPYGDYCLGFGKALR